MSEKKKRRFYVAFMGPPIPPFKLKCWECGNIIKIDHDENGYYIEEASEIIFDPPKEIKVKLVPTSDEKQTYGEKT